MEENYRFSSEAKLELHRALCYFKLMNKDGMFMDELISQLRLITSMPTAFQIKYKNIRVLGFNKFNYSIHYVIKEGGNIIIYHIFNQKQDF
ncbi:type II toxin-antitoxin system RelE/ParE family toxin [Flavivirga algicola]|uniref:Type II toxin-antitoxin system RelE/ParE family toxin n=1 Tax=Flavivirga algicola TaxID=2729136 RepID=A0ABX1RY51_9FLAO|nr:type II toxin-antitoxin system RelE/ParE family toxin [Flavivirga algicola]NMH87265.1 type II toxin-antitoxin system RelE/ParE family toxin [Flavivirga algicola]